MTKIYDLQKKRIFVAGHRGMVGSAIVRHLRSYGCEIITAPRQEVDLLVQEQTEQFLAGAKPDVVIMAAAKVGGIVANSSYPAEFIRDNLAIALNTIHGAYRADVQKLLFLGSSCIYPRLAEQPMAESELLTGPLEPTNQWYAIAKIAGIKLCQAYRRQYGVDFISVMPPNLYGPGDNYHPENSHMVPALIRRFHEAKVSGAREVIVWGTGTPRRELMFVEDCASACIFALEHYSEEEHLNIGTGEELTIGEFAQLVAEVVGFAGKITYDQSRPDGTPRKLLDNARLAKMGWQHRTSLRQGLALSYRDFLDHAAAGLAIPA